MCVVTFDLTAFRARYPEFSAVADGTIAAYFSEATIYLDNTDCSPVRDCVRRAILFNMLTAHIAALASGAAAGNPVGNLTSATEGTVSASFDSGAYPGSAAWFKQTQYGLSYYQATAGNRLMKYVPGRSTRAPLQGLNPLVRPPWRP